MSITVTERLGREHIASETFSVKHLNKGQVAGLIKSTLASAAIKVKAKTGGKNGEPQKS